VSPSLADHVIAPSALGRVGLIPAVDDVVSTAAADEVDPIESTDPVIPGLSLDHIRSRRPSQAIVAGGARDGGLVAVAFLRTGRRCRGSEAQRGRADRRQERHRATESRTALQERRHRDNR
jgi:hypothetical protein